MRTDFISRKFDFLLNAKDRFFKRQRDLHLQVAAATRRLARAAACGEAEPTKKIFENVAEIYGVVMEAATHATQPFLAEAIITGPFIGIRKHTVGFVKFFEFLL